MTEIERNRDESTDCVSIHGAREHNLKNLSVAVPRNRFVVITGVSGSGKSTLAFDLLFAEGQRRFLESMNTYARQFVEQLPRPDLDSISGIPPTVSIEQRHSRGAGKSTVATATEIHQFLRLLFSRLGTPYCPECQMPVQPQTRDQLDRQLESELKRRGDLLLLAPVVRNRKGFHSDVVTWAARHGYQQVRADRKLYSTDEPFRLDRFREHDVEIVTGALEQSASSSASTRENRRQQVDETLKMGRGTLYTLDDQGGVSVHSTKRTCPRCERSLPELDPKNFSYNSPTGWCPTCRGFGVRFHVPDVDRGSSEDAVEETWFHWKEDEHETCIDCQGTRLNPTARSVRLILNSCHPLKDPEKAPTINTFARMSVQDALAYFKQIKPKGREGRIARDILPEIRERLTFLNEVGLDYLELGRAVTTLSGGESQRIRLAAQLGSNLSGVLYILDEPTIGLHARDNVRLLAALNRLRDRGNSVVVVEHDEETMRQADHIIDLGPGAGIHGGQLVASGSLSDLLADDNSVTGQCLRVHPTFPERGERRPVSRLSRKTAARKTNTVKNAPAEASHSTLRLTGASRHNLKDITVDFPLSRLIVVTGVSGSGKSTLIRDCLLPTVHAALKKGGTAPQSGTVSGHEDLKAVYEVDQSPIGRTPRSIPATYVGFFDEIRRIFSQLPEARLRGYTPGRFSFNSAQGRCPSCQGAGIIKMEMSFLPPAYVPCETCHGARFNQETLDIELNGKNISDVLEMSVNEALDFFSTFPKVRHPLEALESTGLGYIKLGQNSPTLSGGEAQRLKLVTHLLSGLKETPELRRRKPMRKLFLLEEPTIGLHMADVRRLVEVCQKLVDAGHTVMIIEHNLDLIAEADWIIDLGPEGGENGGHIVAEGTPEAIAKNRHSHTGRFLRKVLAGTPA